MIYYSDKIYQAIQDFKRWKYQAFHFTPTYKRNLISLVMLICVITLLMLIAFDPKVYEMRNLVLLIVFLALGNLIWLQYLNHRESPMISPMKGKLPYYSSLRNSPFNPKSEQMGKQIIQETSEQLESNTKNFAKKSSFSMEYNSNPLEASFTKRKLNFTSRPQDNISLTHSQNIPAPEPRRSLNPLQTSFSRDVRESSPGPYQARQSQTFKPFIQQEKKTLRKLSPPKTFQEPTPRNRGSLPSSELISSRSSDIHASPLRGTSNNRYLNLTQNSRIFSDEITYQPILEVNMEKKEAAEKVLKDLKIGIPEFTKWKENCQRWFTERLIPMILNQNSKNLKDINKILGYFDKRLNEYETILKIDQASTSDPISQRSYSQLLTIDDLLSYETSCRKGGPMWTSAYLSHHDATLANEDLLNLIRFRRDQEKYFDIEGFKISEIRAYVLERLFKIRESFQKNFTYHQEGILKKKMPTDTMILSNLFFKWLNNEIAKQSQNKNIYRNFVYKSSTNSIVGTISSEDIYFQQTTFNSLEPHYDIIAQKKIYPVIPGKDNLFAAIVLFGWHVRSNTQGNLGFEQSKEFAEFLKEVIPSY